MKKTVYLLICLLLLAFSYASYAQVPAFTGGHTQNLVVCKNSAATSIDTLMKVSDTSTGHRVVWSIFVAPAHGTLVAADTITSTGGTLTPAGITYMPATGYSGTDVFTVEFADSGEIDTTMITVTVDTLLNPETITGPSGVCIGASITLSDATTGGAWGISNSSASVSGAGDITGVHGGVDTVSYSLSNVCGIVSTTAMVTVNTLPNAGRLATPDSVCAGGHLALRPRGDAGGIWHSANIVSATVNDTGLVAGIAPGSSRITYIITNGCGSDTASAEVKVQIPVLPIVLLGIDTVCQFQMLTLIDPSAGGAWTSSSFFVAAVVGGIVIGVTPGDATITYTLHNACGATTTTQDVVVEPTSYCAVDTVTAVDATATAKEGLSIFPNPNNGAFTLNISSGTNSSATVVITNAVGEKIREFSTNTNQAIDVQMDSPAGLYFVRVSTANGSLYSAKVIVR